ncbi:hypothetical protein JCM16106_08250 [Hydrogenophilus islandicus]
MSQVTKRLCAFAGAAIAGLLLAGCQEKPQVYTPGQSTAAPDTPPYASPQFNGNRQQWEQAVATRAKGQNDYLRAQ